MIDKIKFMNMAQNVFSKEFNCIAINKEQDKIITDIFTKREEIYRLCTHTVCLIAIPILYPSRLVRD